jgi:hypothetical protein
MEYGIWKMPSPQNPFPDHVYSPLELPTIFVLFDSAFAITEKVLYVEMRVFR